MQVVHPKPLGIFFSYACIYMFDKQCKCLQEIKERKRKGGKCPQCKRQLQFEKHCAFSLTCNALAIPTTHSFSLSSSLFLVLSITSLRSLLLFLSLCAASCFLLLLLLLLWLTAFWMHCVCEKQQTHTHTTRTHSKKIMQIKLNAIWESTRRPNFTHTHTHTHEVQVQVCVCVCVIQVTVLMLSLFIHIFNTIDNNWLSC